MNKVAGKAHRIVRLVLVVALLAPAPLLAQPRPQRIVSLNLCADQYLLALADRGQIAALTNLAGDAGISAYAGKARGLPMSAGTAEEVLALDPDLIIAAPGRRLGTLGALAGRNYHMLELPSAESFAQIVVQIRQVAAAVGHPARGEALIRRMRAGLDAIVPARSSGVAAFYQRRGYLTGTATLIDEIMRRAGLENLAARLGKPALSQLSLEELVAARPDFIIFEQGSDGLDDQGTEMLRHPVLRGVRRLYVPRAWTVCGGPAYLLAVQGLASQAARQR